MIKPFGHKYLVMRLLYHFPLDPESRQARLVLAERELSFKLEQIKPWATGDDFLHLCIEAKPPCLVEIINGQKHIISTSRAICEYLADGASKRTLLMPSSITDRAETRRLCQWFDVKFATDVNAYILAERIEKPKLGGVTNTAILREGREYLRFHLDYFSWLLEQRNWLACNERSLADFAAGAHISCLDYLGEIDWDKWPVLKNWYQKLKSRPSFQPLLKDRIAGIMPPPHYADLDF